MRESARLTTHQPVNAGSAINQACFEFHGVYAAGVASTSPLARQLWELRLQSDHVGDLVKTLQTISDYPQFLDLLDSFGIER